MGHNVVLLRISQSIDAPQCVTLPACTTSAEVLVKCQNVQELLASVHLELAYAEPAVADTA